MSVNFPITIEQGATFNRVFNWYGAGKVMKAIEAITAGYPTIITITGHGLPTNSDTPLIISGVEDSEELNSKSLGIQSATYISADTFSMPVSTVGVTFSGSLGEATWYAPSDISAYTARMQIRAKKYSDTIIHTLTTENGGITLNGEDGSIALFISDTDTTAFTFNEAWYDIELISDDARVIRLIQGTVLLDDEVTQ